MSMMLVIAAVVAAGASAPVNQAGVATGGFAAPPTKAEAAGDPDQMICKHITTTGTRFPTKDCRTRAAWNQLTADSRQAVRDLTANQAGLTGAGPVFNGK